MKNKILAMLVLNVLYSPNVHSGIFVSTTANLTINQAYLAANPGTFDYLEISYSGFGANPTLTIDLGGAVLPMTFQTGYIKAMNGAKLIIKNCIIQGDNARKLWLGIVLINNSNQIQNTILEMENVTLNYAWDGVFAGDNMNPAPTYTNNGALLKINNCKFYNCRTGVTFPPFGGSNSSRVESSKFVWDKLFDVDYYVVANINDFMYGNDPTFMEPEQFRSHILMFKNKDIALLGNEFYNYRPWEEWGVDIVNGYRYQRVPNARRKGTGIFAISSSCYVGSSAACYAVADPEPGCYNCYGKASHFEGLYIGFLALNEESIYNYGGQFIDIMNCEFMNNTHGIAAGFDVGGIYTNLGISVGHTVHNIFISGNNFKTDNAYYYHEAIMTKNAEDVLLIKVSNYQIIRNIFTKKYDNPSDFNLTDQVCNGTFGREFLGNILIKNCGFAVSHGVSPAYGGNVIYQNYFENAPWVRCTNMFGSITFEGINANTGNNVTDVQVECNRFHNSHPIGHTDGSVNDIILKPDESNNDACDFNGYKFGQIGAPSHNKFTDWSNCASAILVGGYNFLYLPAATSASGVAWQPNPAPVEYYYNSNSILFPQQNRPKCILNEIGNHTNYATTLGGEQTQVCYPDLYKDYCTHYTRDAEVQSASSNPNTIPESIFSSNFGYGVQALTTMGVNLYPTVYTGGNLTVNYNFGATEYYLMLYIYNHEGTLIKTILLPQNSFDVNNNFDIQYLVNSLPPGTYYFTFRNSAGQWQTIIIIIT